MADGGPYERSFEHDGDERRPFGPILSDFHHVYEPIVADFRPNAPVILERLFGKNEEVRSVAEEFHRFDADRGFRSQGADDRFRFFGGSARERKIRAFSPNDEGVVRMEHRFQRRVTGVEFGMHSSVDGRLRAPAVRVRPRGRVRQHGHEIGRRELRLVDLSRSYGNQAVRTDGEISALVGKKRSVFGERPQALFEFADFPTVSNGKRGRPDGAVPPCAFEPLADEIGHADAFASDADFPVADVERTAFRRDDGDGFSMVVHSRTEGVLHVRQYQMDAFFAEAGSGLRAVGEVPHGDAVASLFEYFDSVFQMALPETGGLEDGAQHGIFSVI